MRPVIDYWITPSIAKTKTIDESIVRYFEKYASRQRINNKPIRVVFGGAVWIYDSIQSISRGKIREADNLQDKMVT